LVLRHQQLVPKWRHADSHFQADCVIIYNQCRNPSISIVLWYGSSWKFVFRTNSVQLH
jgi:hypothetical protein